MKSMVSLRTALLGLSALALGACATPATSPDYSELTPRQRDLMIALASYSGAYDLSDAAMATAVRDERGDPVGLLAYDDPADAIRAGDTAAFISAIKTGAVSKGETSAFAAVVMSLDQAAGFDYARAVGTVAPALEDDDTRTMASFLNAWYLALDGQADEAIRAHRQVSSQLPGLTGDLSLAGMLEALGRNDEALVVYDTMMPTEIVAPDHDFDPQGLVFSHVRLVVARKALLLRKEGRIEEAQAVYQRLADAEPEEAVSYADAIDALATGRGIEDEAATLTSAMARAMVDYSLSLAYQRIFAEALMGNRSRGFDDTKGAFDQLALLIDPANEPLRLNVHDALAEVALYDGALHVLTSAPEPSAQLKMVEASTLLRLKDEERATDALKQALKLADEDEELSVNSGAMALYSLMKKEAPALDLAARLPELAETPAEKASAYGQSSAVYRQFAQYQDALTAAKAARELDDTHARRVALSDALAEAGQIEEGLSILRSEALARPNDPYMLNTLGYYLVLHTDRLEEAFKVLARASALQPNDSYIADSFGWVRYKMGDLEGARRYIELSRRELQPNRHWEIEDHLGDVYWHLGRKEDAKEAWGYALKEHPPTDERARIQDKYENGLLTPPPEKRALPDVSLEDDGEITRQDI
ncbi:MAG: hypothetical protein AAFZ91_00415 [Pseudomonadota bacterium]